jgi:hypothetical protein
MSISVKNDRYRDKLQGTSTATLTGEIVMPAAQEIS